MSDLLNCPFCGSEAECVEWEDGNYPTMSAQVQCNCGAKGRCCGANNRLGCADAQNGLHRSKAIAEWNTRAPLAETLAVMADATLYGTGIMQDGKRIDPHDFFDSPDPAAPTGHWKDACRESNGPEICDEPCSKCLRAIGERADG